MWRIITATTITAATIITKTITVISKDASCASKILGFHYRDEGLCSAAAKTDASFK
jgi:hypothetical protein